MSCTPSFFLRALYPPTSGFWTLPSPEVPGGEGTSRISFSLPRDRSFMNCDGRPEITVTYCLARDRATNIRRLSSL